MPKSQILFQLYIKSQNNKKVIINSIGGKKYEYMVFCVFTYIIHMLRGVFCHKLKGKPNNKQIILTMEDFLDKNDEYTIVSCNLEDNVSKNLINKYNF